MSLRSSPYNAVASMFLFGNLTKRARVLPQKLQEVPAVAEIIEKQQAATRQYHGGDRSEYTDTDGSHTAASLGRCSVEVLSLARL